MEKFNKMKYIISTTDVTGKKIREDKKFEWKSIHHSTLNDLSYLFNKEEFMIILICICILYQSVLDINSA